MITRDFSNNTRLISHINDLTEEQIELARQALECGIKLSKIEKELQESLGDKGYTQFFGRYDCMIIHKKEEIERDID